VPESELAIPRGKRIVVEGNDGTGKSTVADMFGWQVRKNGFHTIRIDEPNSPIDEDGTVMLPHIAELRREIKDGSYPHNPHADLAMFNVARYLSLMRVEKPYLELGYWMIKSRDKTSSEAYQGNGDGLGIDTVTGIIDNVMQDDDYLHPDFKTILVFKDEMERLKRIESRGPLDLPDTFESRDGNFQQRVNDAYPVIAARDGFDITEIETGQSREEIADIVLVKAIGAIGVNLSHFSWDEYWEEQRSAV